MRQWRFGDFVAKIVFVFPPFLFTWQHDQPIFISKVFPCFFKFFYVSAAAEVRGFWCQDRLCFFPAIFVYAATETCWLALFSCTTIVLFLVLEAALASSSSWQKIMT
jgi:hypothetical protein